jgi:putative ABC transport system permease protein
MNLLETFRLAFSNIKASKVRTFLTMLGIIIGVTAVIVIEGLGNGMEIYMRDQFAVLGTNTISVNLIGRGTTRKATVDDMYEIAWGSQYLQNVSPTVNMSGGIKVGSERHRSTSVQGVSEDYMYMKSLGITLGRGLRYMDIEDRKTVCIVGAYVNKTYYNGGAVGDTVKIGTTNFKIVGVAEQQDDDEDLAAGGNDDFVYVPYSTAARLSHVGTISSYTFTMIDENSSDQAVDDIKAGLYKIYRDDNAYLVISMVQLLDIMTTMLNVMIKVLAIIAGISLVVGGVGIMNIMLVSVTERTKEIGIRKALGAKESIILKQFVIEAAITSALGGVVGIIMGFLGCRLATALVGQLTEVDMSVIPSWISVLRAFGISAGIGVLFGYLPAKKAADLNPIDALRYE